MEAELNASLPCYSNSLNITLYKIQFHCSFLTINLSSCHPIQSRADVESITDICRATGIVWNVGFWFSLTVGVIGNGLAIFTIRSLPKSTSTFYVGLLAVSDLSALCIRGAIDVLSEQSIITQDWLYSDLIAVVFDYCASYSNWLLVLIGLERFLTMRFPLQKRSLLTLRRAQMSAVLLALVLLSAYIVAVSTLDYTDSQVFGVRNMLYAVLPVALNFFIIILISCQLRRAQRAREEILLTPRRPRSVLVTSQAANASGSYRQVNSTPGTPTSTVASPHRHPNTLQNIAHLENSITVMMLVAAVCFLLLTMPNCVLLYCYQYMAHRLINAPVFRARWLLLSRITELLTFLNLSVNFVLYFLSAKKFRSHLYRVLTPKSWSVRSGNQGVHANNTTSHNNSVFVFRAIQQYRLSENGSETTPLKSKPFPYETTPLKNKLSTTHEKSPSKPNHSAWRLDKTDVDDTEISPVEGTKRSDLGDSLVLSQGSNDDNDGRSREDGCSEDRADISTGGDNVAVGTGSDNVAVSTGGDNFAVSSCSSSCSRGSDGSSSVVGKLQTSNPPVEARLFVSLSRQGNPGNASPVSQDMARLVVELEGHTPAARERNLESSNPECRNMVSVQAEDSAYLVAELEGHAGIAL